LISAFKIFGERHTGTNALSLFIRENFPLKMHYYEFLGWKHRLAPNYQEFSKFNISDTLFIFLIRNPYAWLQAMYREPYYNHYHRINELPFEEFLTFQFEDYENLMAMWSIKNTSYLEMAKWVPNALVIKLEDFRNDQNEVFKKISGFIPPKQERCIELNSYINGRGHIQDQDIDKNLRMNTLSQPALEIINRNLDFRLMASLKYDLMETYDE